MLYLTSLSHFFLLARSHPHTTITCAYDSRGYMLWECRQFIWPSTPGLCARSPTPLSLPSLVTFPHNGLCNSYSPSSDRVDWNKVPPDRSSDFCSFLDIHLPSISDNLVSCCDPMCKGSFMSNHALDLPLDSAPRKLSSLKQIREPCFTALLQVAPTSRIRWWIMINSTLFLLTETCELRSSQMALSLSFAPICHHSHPPAQKTRSHPDSHSCIRSRATWTRCPHSSGQRGGTRRRERKRSKWKSGRSTLAVHVCKTDDHRGPHRESLRKRYCPHAPGELWPRATCEGLFSNPV